MASRIPIMVGERLFPNRANLFAHYSAIVQSYAHGQEVSPEHAAEFTSLLVSQHPDGDEITSDVTGYRVIHEHSVFRRSKNHVEILRQSVEPCLVGWVKACRGFASVDWGRLGARSAIHGQIVEFRQSSLLRAPECAETGVMLDEDTAVVDHWPITFAQLYSAWLRERGLDSRKILVTHRPNTPVQMSDPALRTDWQDYHETHCTLRIVTRKVNSQSWREVI